MLQPSMNVYILPLSFVDYHVERRKHGKTEIVTMPSDQYVLEVTNSTVGRLERKKSRVTGLVVGYTEVVLQDKSILANLCCSFFFFFFHFFFQSHVSTVFLNLSQQDMLHTPSALKPTAGIHVVPPHHLGNRTIITVCICIIMLNHVAFN